MRILKNEQYRRMPWRNGHGETAQIAISPAAGTLEDFDWRVSMARIEGDGPFSQFPHTDRTLAVLRGDGLHLSIGDSARIKLTRHSEPLVFRGDVAADTNLVGGAVTDLNVMTRRERFTHSMRRVPVARHVELTAEASLVLLVCADGSVQVDANGQTEALNSLDTALLDQVPATVSIATDGAALVYLIEIHRAS